MREPISYETKRTVSRHSHRETFTLLIYIQGSGSIDLTDDISTFKAVALSYLLSSAPYLAIVYFDETLGVRIIRSVIDTPLTPVQ